MQSKKRQSARNQPSTLLGSSRSWDDVSESTHTNGRRTTQDHYGMVLGWENSTVLPDGGLAAKKANTTSPVQLFSSVSRKKKLPPSETLNTAIRLPQSAELAKQDYVKLSSESTAPNERPQPLSRGRVVLLDLCLGFCASENGGSYYRGVMITSGAAPSLRRAREASMWPFMLEMCSADAPSLRIDGKIGPRSVRQAANRNRNARVLHRDPTCYVWGCAGFVKTNHEPTLSYPRTHLPPCAWQIRTSRLYAAGSRRVLKNCKTLISSESGDAGMQQNASPHLSLMTDTSRCRSLNASAGLASTGDPVGRRFKDGGREREV